MKKNDVYTIDAYRLETEEEVYDAVVSQVYYTYDEAYKNAQKLAFDLMHDEDVINVTVYGGEWEDENGNIFGEPTDMITFSNKPRKETMEIRKEMGYSNLEVDVYVEPNGQTSL